MKLTLFVITLAALAILTSCFAGTAMRDGGIEVPASGTPYMNVSPEQLNSMLKNKDILLINVHIPYDGEIAGTDLFIPFDKIDEMLELLPDKHAKIFLYCRSGYMSSIAAKALVQSGYTDILNLQGGMRAWHNEGYELIQKQH